MDRKPTSKRDDADGSDKQTCESETPSINVTASSVVINDSTIDTLNHHESGTGATAANQVASSPQVPTPSQASTNPGTTHVYNNQRGRMFQTTSGNINFGTYNEAK